MSRTALYNRQDALERALQLFGKKAFMLLR